MPDNIVNIHEAKTHLSKLLARVRNGEEIVLAKAGTPIAKLVPITPQRRSRKPGGAKGLVIIHDNFDDPLPDDLLDAFGP
jgi:prevent-host-death family protein